jgi:hypothetical protein
VEGRSALPLPAMRIRTAIIRTTVFLEFRAIRWSALTTPPQIFRLTRRLYAGDRIKLELMAESFNLFNRDNQRVQITQDGFQSNSAQFVQTTKTIGINIFPAQYRVPSTFLHATDAYAPRQIQLALKLIY